MKSPFRGKALFRLFVSSADREPPDGIKKHFEVTSYVLETPSGNGLLFGVEEEMSRCLPADMMKEQQRAKFTKRVAFWNNFKS